MKSNVLEALIGTLVLVIAAVFLSIAYKASSSISEKGIVLHAKFDRIDGLVIGNDVKVSGVKVGKVIRITLDPHNFLADVAFTIPADLPLPQDSSAEIVSESLMGGKYIAIVPGGADQLLKNGDVITYTQSALSFEALIGKYLFSNNGDSNESSEK